MYDIVVISAFAYTIMLAYILIPSHYLEIRIFHLPFQIEFFYDTKYPSTPLFPKQGSKWYKKCSFIKILSKFGSKIQILPMIPVKVWCRTGDNTLPKSVMTQFTDAHLRHRIWVSYRVYWVFCWIKMIWSKILNFLSQDLDCLLSPNFTCCMW